MSKNQIATIVERTGGEVIQVGDFQITLNEKLKLDKVIYNDILARRGFDAMQNNLTEAQYADKFKVSPSEYNKAKNHAEIALKHIVPDQFRISAETDIHIKMDEMVDEISDAIAMADEGGDKLKGLEIKRKAYKDILEYMKSVGLVSNQSADKFAQAKEVIGILINFILREKDEAKRYSVECPHCNKRFVADVSDKYSKRVMLVHDILKGYDVMDIEGTEN